MSLLRAWKERQARSNLRLPWDYFAGDVVHRQTLAMALARHAEVTVNGIGERAGNASLEEVVLAIKTRKDIFGGLYTT